MYWIRAGLPILSGTSVTELTTALHASFRHDLLDHHKEFTRRESLREPAPSVLDNLFPHRRTRRSSKLTNLVQTIETAPKPEFAEWATTMLDAAESYITGLAKWQNESAYQPSVMEEFANRLDAFRRAEKLASLPASADIEDKIDAGYFEDENTLREAVIALWSNKHPRAKLERIYCKAWDLRGDEGFSAVLCEFRELIELMK